jgi:hypothetical protein
MVVTIGAFFGSGGGSETLTCELFISATGGSLARAVLSLSVYPTLWPLWADAIVVSDAGDMFSTQLAETRNGTDALLAACAACFASFDCGEGFIGICELHNALSIPLVVLVAAAVVWEDAPPPTALSVTLPFS